MSPKDYPLSGLGYLITHPSLWPQVICPIIIGFIAGLIAVIVLLSTALKPQADSLSHLGDFWAWFIAIIACLVEALIILIVILKKVASVAQTKVFVKTMEMENCWNQNWSKPNLAELSSPFGFDLLVKICSLPLNLIPVAGTILYGMINMNMAALDIMSLYYDASGISEEDQKNMVFGGTDVCSALTSPLKGFENEHSGFGFVCAILEMVPVLGATLIPVSNSIGGALWACDMEKCKMKSSAQQGYAPQPQARMV